MDDLDIAFDGKLLTIPASCVTDRSIIMVTVVGDEGTTILDDWTVKNVDRHNSERISDFTVTFESKQAGEYKFQVDDTVTIRLIPVTESEDEFIEFRYKAVAVKKLMVLDGIGFERVSE